MTQELHKATALVETVRAALLNAAGLGNPLDAAEVVTLETVLAVALTSWANCLMRSRAMARKQVIALTEGGRRCGESHPRAKLSDHEVDLVIALREEGMPFSLIGEKLDISKGAAWKILHGLRRGHAPARWRTIVINDE